MNTPPPDHHEASREAFESKWSAPWQMKATTARTKSGRYEQGTVQHFWEHWCRALDWQASQQEKEREHACALNMDMMGTCFVCGSVNESIRAMRDEQAATEPQPDWRPLEPGEKPEKGDIARLPDSSWFLVWHPENLDAWYEVKTRRPKPTTEPQQSCPECIRGAVPMFDGDGNEIGLGRCELCDGKGFNPSATPPVWRTDQPRPLPTPESRVMPPASDHGVKEILQTPEPQCPACVQAGGQCLGCGLVEHGTPACIDCGLCHDGPCALPTPEPQGAVEWARKSLVVGYGESGIENSNGFRCLPMENALELAKRCEAAENELERERCRLAACGVVALSDTPESAKQARQMHPDYESASCRDVKQRVDECIALRAQLAEAQDKAAEQGRHAVSIFDEYKKLQTQLASAQTEARELGELVGLASTSFLMLEAYLGPQWFEAVAHLELAGPDKIHARAALAKYQPQTTTPE